MALVADHLQCLYDLSRAGLLLDLFRHEPLQKGLACVIFRHCCGTGSSTAGLPDKVRLGPCNALS